MWETEVFGNTVREYATSGGLFVALVIFTWLFQKLFLIRLRGLADKTKNHIDNQLVTIVGNVKPPFYVTLSFLVALQPLSFTEDAERLFTALLLILLTYQVIRSLYVFINYAQERITKERGASEKEAVETIGSILKALLWVTGGILILQNIGFEVTTLIAGLGVGGIAIAFALQNILGDLFNSFAIIFDKPFVPGDFIVVGKDMGVVEDIGIKTTRIRALQGEEIIISNTELTGARIQNYKRMKERRVTFRFGLLYETNINDVKAVPDMVKEIIEGVGRTRFDRAHFFEFADSALNFEVVYYVISGDYNEYMDIHQEIITKIKERLDKEKIQMAYPTRRVYLSK